MPSFALRGLTLTLPEAALRGGLEKALSSGRYEHQEADAILSHLRPGDRFLDLGAGLGFLCALAARVVGQGAVTGVEAGPDTLALARANLNANGFPGVQLIHGAVTATAEGEVDFGQRPAFWASALRGPKAGPPMPASCACLPGRSPGFWPKPGPASCAATSKAPSAACWPSPCRASG